MLTSDHFLKFVARFAAKQAQLNETLAHMNVGVDQGSASTGESLKYGALQWQRQGGNDQQQYSKLIGGSLDALTNDASNLFSSMVSDSQSASQAFKAFATSHRRHQQAHH